VSGRFGTYVHKTKGVCHQVCPSRKHVAMKMGERRPARRRQGQRGFKRWDEETARRNFEDPRSYVSLDDPPHLILFGKDKAAQRQLIFAERDGVCEIQGPNCLGRVSQESGHWHHVASTHNQFRRCDCKEGAVISCEPCHRGQHVQVHLRRIPQLTTDQGFCDETDAMVKDSIGE
jgi:hypothetical protein